jgi:hypothetical protein
MCLRESPVLAKRVWMQVHSLQLATFTPDTVVALLAFFLNICPWGTGAGKRQKNEKTVMSLTQVAAPKAGP